MFRFVLQTSTLTDTEEVTHNTMHEPEADRPFVSPLRAHRYAHAHPLLSTGDAKPVRTYIARTGSPLTQLSSTCGWNGIEHLRISVVFEIDSLALKLCIVPVISVGFRDKYCR